MTLSLVHLTRGREVEFLKTNSSGSTSYHRVPSTLVIAPLTTIESWIKEIKQIFNPDSLPFLLFHSNKKLTIGLTDVKKSAIVLVTYETLIINMSRVAEDKKNKFLDLLVLIFFNFAR